MPATHSQSPDDLVPFRRSLRASQARRAKAQAGRRRSARSRSAAVGVLAGLAALTSGATAQPAAAPGGAGSVAAVQAALGIPADGIAGPQTRRAVRAFERRQGLRVDGRIDPRVRAALGVTRAAAARSAAKAGASPLLEAIALCESGGDPTAVSPNGRYRGKYQFSVATWRSLGGTGDPAAAPESKQDRLAAELLAQRGTAPWPACSRKVGA